MLAALLVPVSGQNWLPLKKKLDKMEKFQKASESVLLDSVGVTFDKNGSGEFRIHKVLKVNNHKGVRDNRVIIYDYDPLTAFAKFRRVTVYKADGSVKEMNLENAVDYAAPARMIYWGARQIMIGVDNLEKGDIIDYEIDKSGFTYALLDGGSKFIPPMKGHYYDIVPFWTDYPTIEKVYTIDLPLEKPVQYKFYQGECQTWVKQKGDRKLYGFARWNVMPVEKEQRMRDLFDEAPKLMISSTERWEDKSLWFHGVNEDYDAFAAEPDAQKMVDRLIRGKKTDWEKIAALTHWVADNMRYSGISMGKGEGFTLHNTKMNFTDRCGVCKDKAALLISFLRMAGFEAYPAMTMAGSRIEAIPADHFNHCVAVVKVDGEYHPLDPTWVPFLREEWSSAEQQQNYLPGTPEGSPLCLTPVSAPENHYLKFDISVRLDEQGNLRGRFVVGAEGQTDSAIRRAFTTGQAGKWREAMEKVLLDADPSARLTSVNYGSHPERYMDGPIKITFNFVIPHYAVSTSGGELLMKPLSGRLYRNVRSYLRLDTSLKERQFGFNDRCSRLVLVDERITLPKGYRLAAPIQEKVFESPAADFRGSAIQNGRVVRIDQELALKKRVYEADDWPGFRTAVNMHRDMTESIMIFQK